MAKTTAQERHPINSCTSRAVASFLLDTPLLRKGSTLSFADLNASGGGKGGGLSISEIWLQIIMLPWNVPQPNKSHGLGYTKQRCARCITTQSPDTPREQLGASLRSTAEIPLSFSEARLSSSVFKGITYKILSYEACVISV